MIWDEIERERALQDAEHGGPDNDDLLSDSDWVGLLTQFAGRAFACSRLGRPDLYRSRLLQVVAIGVAALEAFDRRQGPGKKGAALSPACPVLPRGGAGG